MAKDYIDELLVRLGLEADAKEFKQANEWFTGLRTRALAFGAVVGSVAYGMNKLVSEFAAANDPLGKFADLYGTTPQFVNSLGFALAKSGGNAEEAFSSIKKIRDLMKDTRWGEIASDVFREAGVDFDPMLLAGVTDVADAYEIIADAVSDMNGNKRREVLQEMGFSDSEITLFAGGKEKMLAYFREAERLAPVTREMTDNAARFNNASLELEKAIEGLADQLANRLSPELSGFIERLAGTIGDNRKNIVDAAETGVEKATEYLDFSQGGPFGFIKRNLFDQFYVPAYKAVGGYIGDAVSSFGNDAMTERYVEDYGIGADRGTQVLPPAVRTGAMYEIGTISVDARGATDPAGTGLVVEQAVNKAMAEASRRAVESTREGIE